MKTTPEKARQYIDSLPRAQLAACVYDVLALLALVHDEENDPPVMDDAKECDSGADFHQNIGQILESHDITIATIDAFKPAPKPIGHGTLTIYSSRADVAGHCAHAFSYYDHETARTVNATVGAPSTARQVPFHLQGGTWDPQPRGLPRPILVTYSELGIREFNRLVKGWPDFGCVPAKVAALITQQLAEGPQ
jgi:hypothetical protein